MNWEEPQSGGMGGPRMSPNLWWWLAAGGVLLAVVAYIISFFSHFDTIQDKDKASAVFQMLGFVLFSVTLALMAALQTAWSNAARIAVLLGAGYFTLSGAVAANLFRSMISGFPFG